MLKPYQSLIFGPLEIVLVSLLVMLFFGIARLPAIAAAISRFISAGIANIRNNILAGLLDEGSENPKPKPKRSKKKNV